MAERNSHARGPRTPLKYYGVFPRIIFCAPDITMAIRRRRVMKRRGKKWGKRKSVNVNRALSPFAQRYICKMKYAEQVKVTGPGGAGLAAFRFNLNSIYDPNRTGIGHQPYGYDQLSGLYNRYRVVKCSYVISAYNLASDGDGYSIVAALPANEQVNLVGGVAEAQENPRCKFITQSPGGGLKVLRGTVYLPSLVGRNKTQYMSDDRYQATYGSDPNELAILNVFAGAMDGEALTNTMQLNVVLTYTVESFDVKNQIQS